MGKEEELEGHTDETLIVSHIPRVPKWLSGFGGSGWLDGKSKAVGGGKWKEGKARTLWVMWVWIGKGGRLITF